MNDRIEQGKLVAGEAIKSGDHDLLFRCLTQFKKLGASPQDILATVADCPVSLFEKTDFTLMIHSDIAGRTITLGKDVSWTAIKELFCNQADKEAIMSALPKQEGFDWSVG